MVILFRVFLSTGGLMAIAISPMADGDFGGLFKEDIFANPLFDLKPKPVALEVLQ